MVSMLPEGDHSRSGGKVIALLASLNATRFLGLGHPIAIIATQ